MSADFYAGHLSDDACTICGGDAWEECDDPIQCCAEHDGDPFAGGMHRCRACNGWGLASKQVIW